LGGVFALIIRSFFPEVDAINISFYSMLGMGAVMGASLQAPLAALTAMMELTRMPEVILPGMITIVIANLTASEVFHKKSLFISMLESNGIDITANPVTQSLRRIGVASVMNRSILQIDPMITIKNLNECISNETQWLIIDTHEDEIEKILALGDLVLLSEQYKKNSTDELIDLNLNLEHDIRLSSVTSIHLQATLEEALNKMNHFNIDMLYVRRVVAPGRIHIYGIVTREQIEASYH